MTERALSRAIWFGLSGAFLGAISRLAIVDLDLFHEMALIREALRVGFLPRVDPFSYLPTIIPVVHHEWGTGLVLYFVTVHLGFGAPGLMVLKYLLAAFIAVGCYLFATRQGASNAVFSFLAWYGIGLGWGGFSTIRALLFTLVFLVIFLFLIEADRRGKTWALWVWLAIYPVWLNLHGGFLVGLGLLAIYSAERFFLSFLAGRDLLNSLKLAKRPLLFWLLTGLLTLCNPYGTDYLPYIWNAVTMDRTPFIPEWRPLWSTSLGGLLVWILAVGVVIYCLTQKGLRQMPGLFIIGITAWFSLIHFRHLPIFAIVWTCYAPAYVENTAFGNAINLTWRRNSRSLTAAFVIIGILGTAYALHNQFWRLHIPTSAEEGEGGAPVYPAGAVNYLKDHQFSGNLLVPYDTGAYVSWCLYPQVKVSLDSRFEVAYPVPAVAENIMFYAAQEGWQRTLARYQTDAILVPGLSRLDPVLNQTYGGPNPGASAAWMRVYQDDGFSLYMRSNLAKKFPLTNMKGRPITARFP